VPFENCVSIRGFDRAQRAAARAKMNFVPVAKNFCAVRA
jgi:hypothetical protein